MHIFHIFSIYPAADVDGVPTVQQYDFLVHANTLTEAIQHVKDSWVPVHIKDADEVWGSTRVHTPSLILSPMNQLHQTKSKANYEAWRTNRDPKHYNFNQGVSMRADIKDFLKGAAIGAIVATAAMILLTSTVEAKEVPSTTPVYVNMRCFSGGQLKFENIVDESTIQSPNQYGHYWRFKLPHGRRVATNLECLVEYPK